MHFIGKRRSGSDKFLIFIFLVGEGGRIIENSRPVSPWHLVGKESISHLGFFPHSDLSVHSSMIPPICNFLQFHSITLPNGHFSAHFNNVY